MLVDGPLPGQELVDRQFVTVASFLDAEQAPAHGSHHLRLATDDPALGILGWKIGDGQRTTIWSDDVAYPRPHLLFGHDTRYISQTSYSQ